MSESLLAELLTPIEVSKILKVSPRTLEDWRAGRCGPELPYIRLGARTVRYPRKGVQRLVDGSPPQAQP